MKKFLTLVLTLALTLSLIACGGTDNASIATLNDTHSPKDNRGIIKKIKVANLVNGSLGDLSFLDSSANGMKLIEEKFAGQVETKTIEMSYDNTKWEPGILDASESGYDVIIVGTWQMTQYVEKFAPQYPEITYIVYDASVNRENGDFDNVYCIEYKQNEGSYLAGIVAAKLTQTGTVGFIGGMDIPVVNDFFVGYAQAVRDVIPDAKVLLSYIGAFDDSAKGKDIALTQFAAGVDVNFAVAGGAGLGMFEAAVEKGGKKAGITTIGVDSDQALIFKNNNDNSKAEITATSVLKRIDLSLLRAVESYIDGSLPKAETVSLGVAEGIISLADNEYYQALPADVKDTVEQAIQDIKTGKVTVNSAFGMTTEELDTLRNSLK